MSELKATPKKSFQPLSPEGRKVINEAFRTKAWREFEFPKSKETNENQEVMALKLAAIYGGEKYYCRLGLRYEQGEGVKKDLSRALELYRAASTVPEKLADNSNAQCNLGKYYISIKKYQKALHLLKYAVEKENPLVIKDFNTCFLKLTGLHLDFYSDIRHIKEVTQRIPAESWDVEPYAIPDFTPLAGGSEFDEILYQQGLTFRQEGNYKKAAACFYNAAVFGNRSAAESLVDCYRKGLGVTANVDKGNIVNNRISSAYCDKYLRVFELTHTDIPITFTNLTLGHLYLYNFGSEKQVFEYYKQAANEENYEGIFFLGLCYLHGLGTAQNLTQAIHLLKVAAVKGDLEAAREVLAYCYEWGISVKGKSFYRTAN